MSSNKDDDGNNVEDKNKNNGDDFERIDGELRFAGRVATWTVRPSLLGFRFIRFLTNLAKGQELKCADNDYESLTAWIDRKGKGKSGGGIGSGGEDKMRVRIFRPRKGSRQGGGGGGEDGSQQQKEDRQPHRQRLPLVLYYHGGGYAFGVPEMNLPFIKALVETRACVVVAPDYRLSLDEPYPAAFDDCYAALIWAKGQALADEEEEEVAAASGNSASGGNASGEDEDSGDKGVFGGLARSDQIFVVGHSAGGGLAAAVAIKGRDTGDVNVAFQMPVYPMLDDRQTNPTAAGNSMPVWNSHHNKLAWDLYLRGLRGEGEIKKNEDDEHERDAVVPVYAAPARLEDYTGLPPAATFVGDLDPFLDETRAYVEKLEKAGVPAKFRVFEGCYHGFDDVVPNASKSREAIRFAAEAYADAADTCFAAQRKRQK